MKGFVFKVVSFGLAVALVFSSVVFVFAENTDDADITVRVGDLDGDGKISSKDALVVLQLATGLSDINNDNFLIGDVNEDLSLNSLDALFIMNYITGKLTFFPAEVTRAHAQVLTGGALDVVYYSQSEEPWKSSLYGTKSIGGYGCGPVSMAIVISSLTRSFVDPVCVAEWAYVNGHQMSNGGSYWSLFPDAAAHWGLSCVQVSISNADTIVEALQSGKLVVCSGRGDNPYTSGGHILVLRGVTSEGKILMADPYTAKYPDNSFQEWTMAEIQDGLRAWWIIEKSS